MARPTDFTSGIADEICERLADGESLRTICLDEGKPNRSTVFRWLAANTEFRDQYAHAREAQAEVMADEIIAISDDGSRDEYIDENGNVRTNQDVIGRSRLRVDSRKWLASKLLPKKYGDKITNEHQGPDGKSLFSSIEVTLVRSTQA